MTVLAGFLIRFDIKSLKHHKLFNFNIVKEENDLFSLFWRVDAKRECAAPKENGDERRKKKRKKAGQERKGPEIRKNRKLKRWSVE
jgi:hypothetical protein